MTEVPFLRAETIAAPHGFFTRAGGVSDGLYTSLNCSLSGGDDRARVLENRGRAADALGIARPRLLGLRQVHGARVVTVTQPWAVGEGADADAMVTSVPGLGLGIITADCVPVLFACAETGVVGAAHAGWRGAVGGVLEAVVAAMMALGARRIAACAGPCIGQDSYEVAADLRDAVLAAGEGDARFFCAGRGARWQFDLPGYCVARLKRAGVSDAHALGADTLADEAQFFSHRRRTLRGEAAIGHQIAIIAARV